MRLASMCLSYIESVNFLFLYLRSIFGVGFNANNCPMFIYNFYSTLVGNSVTFGMKYFRFYFGFPIFVFLST